VDCSVVLLVLLVDFLQLGLVLFLVESSDQL
jgi:hypothetical protein